MSSDWIQTQLADVTSALGDGLHGTPEYETDGEYHFVNGSNLCQGVVVVNLLTKRVSSAEYLKYKKPLTDRTVLVSINGTIGNVALYNGEKIVLGKSACYLNVLEGVDRRFVRYVLDSEIFQSYIANLATGSTIKNVSLKLMRDFSFALPSLDEQRRISNMLSVLDDRITLLRKANATLESIAQALFKSWFVDFDPVRAKMEGRVPDGLDEDTAAMFPDGFEESELGLVPTGWKIGALADILSLRNARTQPSERTKALPYVPIESIAAKTPFLQEHKSGEVANSSLILFREGDILFGAMRPYFHKVCSAPFDGVTRTTVFVLVPKNQRAMGFALFQMYQDATVEFATQHSEGSTIPYAKWSKSLEGMPIVLPPSSVQVAFSDVIASLIHRANLNVVHAQSLASLRDTLLPRLISGQLRIPATEQSLPMI